MVALPAGSFLMGSPDSEPGRSSDEGPQRTVRLDAFAAGRFEVTRGQYAAFVAATGRATGGDCWTDPAKRGEGAPDPAGTWRDPAFAQDDRHPVVCVSWEDARGYVAWLKQRTGKNYRLLTEAEWEYAARGGTQTAYFWGSDVKAGCAYANGADATLIRTYADGLGMNCDDGVLNTARVGSYRANPFGLYDMAGNVWEGIGDCYADSYSGLGTNNPLNTTQGCSLRVVRGGAWYNRPQHLRSAFRGRLAPSNRYGDIGFRLARTL